MSKLEEVLIQIQCELVAERNVVNPQEISWLQYDILNLLRNKNNATPSELSKYLGISPSKFSKAIKELKSKNYIIQEINKLDGRGLFTNITQEGLTFLQSVDKGHKFLYEVTKKILSEKEQEDFVNLASKLIKALSKERMERND